MIPTAELPHTVTIEPAAGTTGTGAPAFGSPFSVPARVEGKRRSVRTSTGVDVIADAVATIRPGWKVPVGSRVTLGDRRFTVLGEGEQMELRRPEKVELILEGIRP